MFFNKPERNLAPINSLLFLCYEASQPSAIQALISLPFQWQCRVSFIHRVVLKTIPANAVKNKKRASQK